MATGEIGLLVHNGPHPELGVRAHQVDDASAGNK